MDFRRLITILAFSVLFMFTSVYAQPLVVFNKFGANAASTQVMTIQYSSSFWDFTDPDTLLIAVDPTKQVCLYTTYDSGVCSGSKVCTTAADSHNTGFNLASSSNQFSAGITVSGLNYLATHGGGQGVRAYNCLEVNLNYTTSRDTTLSVTSSNRSCRISSLDGSFIGGATLDNPCAISGGSVAFDIQGYN